MVKTRKIALIFILIFLVNPLVFSEESLPAKNILILFSLTPSTPAYRVISDGIRTELNNTFGDSYYLHMEYLESERYPRGEYPEDRFELYNEKYRTVPLDLIICVGIDVVKPIKENASEKLLNLPAIVVDFDLDDYGLGLDLKLNEHTTIIGMPLDFAASMDMIVSLFPERNTVYFFCGTSTSDQIYCNSIRSAYDQFDPDNKYQFIDNISMDEVLGMVRKLTDSCIVIVPGFNTDSKKVQYYNPEAVRLISMAATAPVFTFSDMGFGDGAIGGYLLSFKKAGILAGETAVRILQGTDPASIIINQKDMHEILFDWRQLKRWNLLGSKLIPKESTILYEERSVFRENSRLIITAIVFLLIQTLMIFSLVILYRKERKLRIQLLETENKFRELIQEDRIQRIGQLTASLSHELNQPLTAILSTAQAGIRFIDSDRSDPALLKELFQNIAEDDKRTATILSSIRGMMKLEKREKERVELNSLIEEIISIYRSEAARNNVSLDQQLDEQPVYILADRIQIQQVLMNLILNAIQSIERSKSKFRLVLVTSRLGQGTVTVSVRDYGTGIDEAIKGRLFKPFVTGRKEGTGIGLSISREIINNHEGNIRAENMPDGGAIFSFTLKIEE